MTRELAMNILALELAQQAHTDYELTIPGSGDTGWLNVTPSAPFEATIMYWITFGEFPQGIFRVNALHKGYTIGQKVLGVDEMNLGNAHWLYITGREYASFKIDNLEATQQIMYMTMWHLNVMKLEHLDLIRLAVWEHLAPGVLGFARRKGCSPPFEYLPDIVNEYMVERGYKL